jgi:hypothetical protein
VAVEQFDVAVEQFDVAVEQFDVAVEQFDVAVGVLHDGHVLPTQGIFQPKEDISNLPNRTLLICSYKGVWITCGATLVVIALQGGMNAYLPPPGGEGSEGQPKPTCPMDEFITPSSAAWLVEKCSDIEITCNLK